MSYIGKAPSVGVRDRYYYTATGGETSISGQDDASRLLTFTDGKYVDVMLNGITLVAGTDYVTTTTNTISGLDALADSDIVEVVVYDVFAVADTVSASRGGTFEGGVTFNGPITINDSADIPTLTGTSLTFDSASFTRISGDLIPLADSTYDLGTPSLKWKDLYLSGSSIFLGDVTLKDEGGSLAVQTSDGGAIDLSARSLNADSATITGNITAATLTGVYAGFDSDFGDQTTDQLSEGSNLYYTTVRADSDFDVRLATKSTTDVAEGSNLYYTTVRADSDVGAYLTANNYATETYVDSNITVAIDNLVGGAPGALDTLNELATALNDDSDFAGTVTALIATKADSDAVQSQFDAIVTDLVSDTSPQLGGTLDANGNTIDMGTNSITDTKVGQWDTAFGWGDHAAAGYADSASVQSQIDAISVTPADVSDEANTSTGFFALPSGTTAQRPGSAAAGYARFNTTSGSLEFFDGTGWVATNLIPNIDSVTGTIYAGAASNLSVSVSNATNLVSVRFTEGGSTLADVTDVDMSTGTATIAVPSAVYGQSAGDTIVISVLNADATPSSNTISKTVVGLPTGGSISTSSGFRYHTFNSSSTFTVPTGFTPNVDAMIVGGGGGGGRNRGGGGGGGGMITQTNINVSSTSYNIVVGGGGQGMTGSVNSTSGSGSSALGYSVNGGGRGGGNGFGGSGNGPGGSGGSGGGAGSITASGGSGTSGQGNSGGNSSGAGAGGGGKGGAGPNATGGFVNGGAGAAGYLGTYAQGGGGGAQPDANGVNTSTSNAANLGNGGGGGSGNVNGLSGSSGIVVIRYQL